MDPHGHIYELGDQEVRSALERQRESDAEEDVKRLEEYEQQYRERKAAVTRTMATSIKSKRRS